MPQKNEALLKRLEKIKVKYQSEMKKIEKRRSKAKSKKDFIKVAEEVVILFEQYQEALNQLKQQAL